MKICAICHQDCSDTPRFKTDLGEYVHQTCYEEQVTLGNELSDVSVQSKDTDKLGWDCFNYCLPCNRPWELEKLELRKRRIRDSNDHWISLHIYYCRKCGTETRAPDDGLGKLNSCLITLFAILLGYEIHSYGSTALSILSLLLLLFSLGMVFKTFIYEPKLNNRLKILYTEWVRQYGVDPKNWPNTYEK